MNLYNRKSIIFKKTYYILIFLTVLISDLGSKQLIINYFSLYECKIIFPIFNFFYINNYGGIFGIFSDGKTWQYWFFIILSITAIIIIFKIIHFSIKCNLNNHLSYVLIISGAVSNLLDRVLHGFIVDFIDLHVQNWHFATFNIADISIFIGSILLLKSEQLSSTNKK